MPILKTGSLPKIQGAGAKRTGAWPGHEAEAEEVRKIGLQAARAGLQESPDDWACLESGTSGRITRLVRQINTGKVWAFQDDDAGTFEAASRHNGEAYELWVRYLPA